MDIDIDWRSITDFRRHLHRHPELSEKEHDTAAAVREGLASAGADEIISGLGVMGTGICAVYRGSAPGPVVALRCELDALAIEEVNELGHRSIKPGVSHMCGHDGHMATMMAVARSLHKKKIGRGKAVLLFQPAEETGTGAAAVVDDPRFIALKADWVFGFHNIPKAPLGRILLRKGLFAMGSVGFIVALKGTTSHSSYPEFGVNPTRAVLELVKFLDGQKGPEVITTLTSAQLGNTDLGPNFGTSPGEARILGIVRGTNDDDIARVKKLLVDKARLLARESSLQFSISWKEEFAATNNHDEAVDDLKQIAEQAGDDYEMLGVPFRWSEDFGRFTQKYKGAFFGLGSGVDRPQLHNNNFDYPDELIPKGAKIYRAILDRYLS